MNKDFLTNEEKQCIKVLNFIATFDGIIQSEDEIKYLMQSGIEKFIPKSRRHLIKVSVNSYPVKITYESNRNNLPSR